MNETVKINISLSRGACQLLAELTERASAPGPQAMYLAELYAAAQRANMEAKEQ